MRRPTRRTAILLGAAVVAGLALTAGLATGGEHRTAAAPADSTATAVTARGDLRQQETVTGTLAYGSPVPVVGRRGGVLTWLPAAGDIVARGGTLWRVDDVPVVLFTGSLPLWRTLRAGTDHGRDVDLVATNLHRLGLWRGRTSGAVYDRYLAAAVAAWQRGLGAPADGVLRPGDVVVAPGTVRIDEVQASLAGAATQQVLTTTSRDRTILLKVPADLAGSLRRGDRVPVTLPSGVTVVTRIARIGGRARGDDGAAPSVAVTVTAAAQQPLDRSVLGAVTGRIVTATARDVVHVPVGALLALAGGGYALERPDHRLIRVEVGVVVDGEAAVTGIEAGVRVLEAS